MKRITNYLKLLLIILTMSGTKMSQGQTCTPTFSYTYGTNGVVNFFGSAPSSTSVSPGTYYWYFPTGSPTGQNVTYTFAANGTYSVSLFYINSASTCSNIITQTVVVNNVSACTPTLNYTIGAGGQVNFTATPSSTTTAGYFWDMGPNLFNYGSFNQDSVFYPSNGPYYVAVTYSTNVPAPCSGTVLDTVVITNAGCNLTAGLSISSSPTTALVNIYNTSTGMNSIATATLDYGDGTPPYVGSLANLPASYIYNSMGSYVMTLTVDNNNSSCTSTQAYPVTITVSPCSSAFNYNVASNGNVTMNGYYTGSSPAFGGSYTWYIGTSTLSGQSAAYTFSANGVYTITLAYTSSSLSACTSTSSQTVSITNVTIPGCSLSANFIFSQSVNGVVNFGSTSMGTTTLSSTYNWDFGDGNTSTSNSPSHTYASNGTYNVWLSVNNNTTPTCVDSIMIPVTVNSICNFTPAYSYTQNNNGVVNFMNSSVGTTTATVFFWNFGGGYVSGANAPTHTYASGSYVILVTATVNNQYACVFTNTLNITVTNTCIANAGFTMSPSGTPQDWNAYVSNPANVASVEWFWGDGSTSDSLYTSHTYSAAGTYDICLSVTLTCGGSDVFCAPYAIYKTSQDMSIIHITVVNPAVATGIKTNSAENVSYAVSPNPNTGTFNLTMKGLSSKNVIINVYNLLGKLVYTIESETSSGKLDKNIQLDEVSNGVYFVKVNSDGQVFTQKMIISRQ